MVIGGSFSGLGAARNLVAHGVPVYIVDSQICVAQFSRHIKRSLRCPSLSDEVPAVDWLLRMGETMNPGGCVVFPTDDTSLKTLSRHRDTLSKYYRITTPSWDIIRFLYDKRLTYQLALQREVPVPRTWYPGAMGELASLELEFPVVLKPAITTNLISVTKRKAYRANDLAQLLTRYEMMASIIDPAEILIQELIPGRAENLYSYFGFFKEGKPVAGYAAKRSRQHPMEFGRASTFAMTVNLPELETLATQLLSALDYSGLAEVEFMYDSKHGRFEFLEVNARIWGWHTLSIHAGVDLPYLAYADAIGEEFSPGPFREGTKWMRLLTDIPTAAVEIWSGRLRVEEYLRSIWGAKDAVLSAHDPLPFIMELFLIPYLARHRGF
jgi:D-aspartate ligase